LYLHAQSSTDAQSRLEMLATEAQKAQNDHDYRTAAKCYEEILTLRPRLPEALVDLGLMHHLLGEHAKAIHDFEAALRQKPDLFVPNLFLGLELSAVNQQEQAIPFFLRAHSVNPRNMEVLKALAKTYLAIKEYDKAVEWYKRAAGVDPQDSDAWYGLGVGYLRLEEMTVSRFGKAGLYSPYFRLLLAQSLEQQGHLNDAVGTYRKLLSSKIDIPCVHTYLGHALVLEGDLKAAEEEFNTDLGSGGYCQAARLDWRG